MSDKNKAIEQVKILKLLIEIADVDIILSTFVSAFINKTIDKNRDDIIIPNSILSNIVWLFGNFNLGGTLSGRLSSSKINLQNLPSTGSIYAKHIKECFVAPAGWIFTGADFNSLEDMISALTTKDPNKLKVYTGHIIYELIIDNTPHHIRDDAIVNFDGKQYTGKEFYDTYS